MFPVVSKSESITPAKFQLNRVKNTVLQSKYFPYIIRTSRKPALRAEFFRLVPAKGNSVLPVPKFFLFSVVSMSESITPAKFQLDRVKTVRNMKALIPIWPPKNYEIFFFVRSKKFLFPVLSGVKDITPAKFQLDRFITVGGVDGQTNTHTHTYPALT